MDNKHNKIRTQLVHHGAASLFVAVLSLIAAVGLWKQFESSQDRLRVSLLEQADRRAIQLSDAIGEQFSLLLRDTDFAIRELRTAWSADRDAFSTTLQVVAERFPPGALQGVAVIAGGGSVSYSLPELEVSNYPVDYGYARPQPVGNSDTLHIGRPVYARVAGQWSIPVSRPLSGNGQTGDMLVIALSAQYLAEQLAKINISEHDIIVLLDDDGAFLARNKELEMALGRTVKKTRPFLADDAPINGVFHASATLDAVPRIFGWTLLPQYDSIVVVGLDQNNLLTPFDVQYVSERRRSAMIIALVIALGASIALLLFRLARQQQALHSSRESLNQAQSIAHLGNWEYDPIANTLILSDEIYRIYGLDPQHANADHTTLLAMVHPDDRDFVQEQYQGALAGRFSYDVEHRIIRPDDGSERWVHERCEHVRNERGEVIRSNGTVLDITERKRLEEELRKLATTDFLTGLHTRRSFIDRLNDELERVKRGMDRPVAVVMIDLDHFKQVNDSHGHAMGDRVLRHFASLIADELRKIDLAGRLGGEEFGLVLSGTDTQAAHFYSERIRKRIEESPLIVDGQAIALSISIGVTELTADDQDTDEVLERADKALYLAKQKGRNRVELYA